MVLEIIFSFFLSPSSMFSLQTSTIPLVYGSQTIAISRPDDYRVKLSAWIFFKETHKASEWEMQFPVSKRLKVALNIRADTCSLAPSGSDLK